VSIAEVLALWGGNLKRYMSDLPLIVLAPRRYLHKVCDEDAIEVFLRLMLYYVFAMAVFFWMWYSDLSKIPNPIRYVEVAFFELVFTLCLVPHFFIVALVAKTRSPLKTSIVYVASMKPLALSALFLLHGLYLATEDYSIAIVKGALTILYLVSVFLFFPAIVGRNARKRLLLAGLSIVLVLGTGIGWGKATETLPKGRGSSMLKYTPLYDPIGVEFTHVIRACYRKRHWGPYEAVEESANALLMEVATSDSLRSDRREIGRRLDCWHIQFASADSIYRSEIDSLRALVDDLKFESPRRLVRLKIREGDMALKALDTLKAFVESPDSSRVRASVEAFKGYSKSSHERMEYELRYLVISNRLRRIGFIYDG